MICIEGKWRAAAAALLLATGGSAMAGSLGGPLELQDEGSFFVNGQLTQSTHPGTAVGGISQPGTITIKQMYVQYRIPKTVSGPPIVMVHGSGHTGATFETTPDGREGWATYFARKGFPVYVVDHAGRGRSGFDPTPFNRARAGEADAKSLPDLQIAPRARGWGRALVGARAAGVLGFVGVEGSCARVNRDEVARIFAHVPVLSVWGDNSEGAPGPNGNDRRNGCASTVAAIKDAGGTAK